MATKIKDGLFIGDAEASQDPEFIELNKITFVINCAGRQLPNLWEQHGLHYLTFPWTSDPDCTLFDEGNVVVEQVGEMPVLLVFVARVDSSYPVLVVSPIGSSSATQKYMRIYPCDGESLMFCGSKSKMMYIYKQFGLCFGTASTRIKICCSMYL